MLLLLTQVVLCAILQGLQHIHPRGIRIAGDTRFLGQSPEQCC